MWAYEALGEAFWRVTIASLGIRMPIYVLQAGWRHDPTPLYR